MSLELRDKSLKEKAWKVCRDFIGGSWKTVALEEFKLFEVRGGLSNALYRCALPANVSTDPGVPKEVLLRIYGPIQENANVVVAEAVTFMLLSERKLGPKLYGLFPTGRLEEFIPSRSMSSDELRSYSPLIAREMAKIHALDIPVKKVPELFTVFSVKWLDEVQEILRKDKENRFMSSDEFKREIEWMAKEMESVKSPIVYCHNDLQGGNVLYREDSTQNGKPKVILIDFEFGAYNYRSFDFANHFNEWCFDYDTDEYPHFRHDLSKFPSKQEQREYFAIYLDQIAKEGVRSELTTEEEISKMLSEVPIFICASHLLWTLWSAKMLLTSSVGFAHKIHLRNMSEEIHNRENGLPSNNPNQSIEAIEMGIVAAIQEHGNTRKKLYQKFKEQYLATTSNGVKDESYL